MTDKYMREVLLPNVKIGLERSGRTWKDIEIAQSGYLVLGENDSDIEQNLDRMRTPLSFYGSTRTYHDVLRLHDLEDLGQKLHRLSLEGKWQEMREVITTDDLLKLTEVCTYDDYPRFINEHREYAPRKGLAMPTRTAEERERSQDIMEQLQAVETTGVPKGMEMTA
jgi:hypothetical protein